MIAHNLTDVCGPRLNKLTGFCTSIGLYKPFQAWGLQNAGREAWENSAAAGAPRVSYLAMRNSLYYESIIALSGCMDKWYKKYYRRCNTG